MFLRSELAEAPLRLQQAQVSLCPTCILGKGKPTSSPPLGAGNDFWRGWVSPLPRQDRWGMGLQPELTQSVNANKMWVFGISGG